MLGIGLLGAGRIGNVHAKAITSHVGSKLVAVSDVNQDAICEPMLRSGRRSSLPSKAAVRFQSPLMTA